MIKTTGSNGAPATTHGFLVGVEVDSPKVDIDGIMSRMVEGVMVMDNVVQADIEYLGALDIVNDVEEQAQKIVQKGHIRES